MKSKPKQKKGTSAKRVVKAWAIIMAGHGHSYLPQVGNGNQWQYPIFHTRKEARQFRAEPHGLLDGKVVEVTIIYNLPSTKLTKSTKK